MSKDSSYNWIYMKSGLLLVLMLSIKVKFNLSPFHYGGKLVIKDNIDLYVCKKSRSKKEKERNAAFAEIPVKFHG
ncbi:MAG: hypothetical protein ACFFCS_11995 [Candidatus Hodarchaeota archaeon]